MISQELNNTLQWAAIAGLACLVWFVAAVAESNCCGCRDGSAAEPTPPASEPPPDEKKSLDMY